MGMSVNRIKQLCKENNTDIKHLEIALKELGFKFSNSTISRWESATKLPPYESVKAVADYFNVPVSWLSFDAYPDKTQTDYINLSANEQKLLGYFRQLNQDGIAKALIDLRDLSENPRYQQDTASAVNS